MSAHTPGPFTATRSLERHDGEFDYAIHDASGHLIAECFGACRDPNIQKLKKKVLPAEANARLFAAAPDLLEAARLALDALEWCLAEEPEGSGEHQELSARTKFVESAIAKAKGETS